MTGSTEHPYLNPLSPMSGRSGVSGRSVLCHGTGQWWSPLDSGHEPSGGITGCSGESSLDSLFTVAQ